MTSDVQSLLSIAMAESNEGVHHPPMLILEHTRKVLKISHALIAGSTDRPMLFRDFYLLASSISRSVREPE